MDETDIKFFKSKKHDQKDNSSSDDDDQDKFKNSSGTKKFTNNVYPIEPNHLPKVSIPANTNLYRNDHQYTGFAIIFNHNTIEGESPRKGTDKDKKELVKSFISLGFNVKICDDYTFEEITNILEKVSKQDFSYYDCLSIIVLSHGETGQVYAKDMIYPVDRLWTPFLGNNCPTLINKPKLFFIQACRGKDLDPGVQYQQVSLMSRGLDTTDAGPERLATYAIPSTADLLIMYSTYEGNYSWRNPVNGSWFIQSLCSEIDSFVKSRKSEIDLFHLLTAVCRKVAYEYQSNVPGDEEMDQMKEMPQIVSTLTKVFYLRIKNSLYKDNKIR